jgi:hypothetical protein
MIKYYSDQSNRYKSSDIYNIILYMSLKYLKYTLRFLLLFGDNNFKLQYLLIQIHAPLNLMSFEKFISGLFSFLSPVFWDLNMDADKNSVITKERWI